MLMRVIPIAATLALCAATVYEIVSPPTPRLLYNKSDSAPHGWYRLDPNGHVTRGSKVAAYAPAQARNLADIRDYLPKNIPLIKTVWAIGGDRICFKNGAITAPNRPVIHALVQDGLGRRMPVIKGCLTLHADEVFLVSTDVQTSWDSRYFGAVPVSNILGTLRYLGNQQDHSAELGGWARVWGVEGKIKGNSAPWALSSCLHIFFGGTPCFSVSAPILGVHFAALRVLGSAPYPQSHAKSLKPSR